MFPKSLPNKTGLEDIIKILQEFYSEADLDIVRKAYVFSSHAHGSQKRRSGEPFMTHPLCVAHILAKMRMDLPTVVSGLLHDTVEDTLVTLDEIRVLFGDQTSKLVDGVTKLGRIQFSSREARQAENFRKMFVAMAEDIRVILIKLADRLHNMRTLDSLPEAKRVRIATETLQIYAPIAGRLGIQEMKVELEDRSFYHLKPEIWRKIDVSVSKLAKKSGQFIEDVSKSVHEELSRYGIKADVQGRFKHYYSIYRKMETQNLDFDQIYDVIGFRVIVEKLAECYTALGAIHSKWRPVPGRFKDYIGMPKLNEYQSLHTTVIGPDGHQVEFQIRTKQMHEVSEWGVAAHWKYKEKGLVQSKDEAKFRWLRQFMEWQRDVSDPAEYLDIVKLDLFATDVYIFTPKGEIKEFPRGSTPVDFAYSVHTDIGHRCVGAKVSGRIVPLKYVLKSGDTVEILVRPDHKPSKDWLKFVETSRARSKIRQYIRSEQREKAQEIGRDLLERELQKFDMNLGAVRKDPRFQDYVKGGKFENFEELAMQVGYGKVTPHQVVSIFVPPEKMKVSPPVRETTLSRIFKRAARRNKGLVRVQGYDDILVSLAKCCMPIRGDSITGFITRGRGVTVHRIDCSRALSLDPSRRIEVGWDESSETYTHTKLRMLCVDRPGILASISQEFSTRGVNIENASCRSIGDQKAMNTFEISVRRVKDLNELIHALEDLKGIISVERIVR